MVWKEENFLMIHLLKNTRRFNIPTAKFKIDNIYKSYVHLGSIKSEGYLSPSGTCAISENKITSIKKTFSEAIERKVLMAGGVKDLSGYISTFDLISNKVSMLGSQFTTYRPEKPHVSDTTGMGAHYVGGKALQKALEELLEKNSLYLFWYGRMGKKLQSEIYNNHPIYHHINKEGDKIMVFMNTYFTPLKTLIVVIYNENRIVSSGISASLYFDKALDGALNEALLLKWENQAIDLRNNYKNTEDDIECLYHLNNYEFLEKRSDIYNSESISIDYMGELMKCIPGWVSNLHVIFLKNTTYDKLTCIKVFSSDLYNHLPQKESLDLEQTINKMTINLDEEELKAICDCVIR
jgi:hypothetical protein